MPKREFDLTITSSMKTVNSGSFADNIKMIDIGKLSPHKENFYSMTDIELLAEDIERQGLKENLVVRDGGDGYYTVISGHRRRQAIILLINEKRRSSRLVPCYINPIKSEEDELQDLIMLNATTRIIDDSQMLEQYERLKNIFEKKKASGENIRMRDKIAEVLKVSTGQVAKMENVAKNASPEVKKAVADGNMSLSKANEVTKKPLSQMTTKEPKSESLSQVTTKDKKSGYNEFCQSCKGYIIEVFKEIPRFNDVDLQNVLSLLDSKTDTLSRVDAIKVFQDYHENE
jgi:ParB family chromosome partitioning protein